MVHADAIVGKISSQQKFFLTIFSSKTEISLLLMASSKPTFA